MRTTETTYWCDYPNCSAWISEADVEGIKKWTVVKDGPFTNEYCPEHKP